MSKKIMFNDRYGLTKAVLDGDKTQTRRIISPGELEKIEQFQVEYYNATFDKIEGASLLHSYFIDAHKERLPYKIGEEVAIAQAYKDLGIYKKGICRDEPGHIFLYTENRWDYDISVKEAGWSNKMFVRADLMPKKFITKDVRFEQLQDISDADCIAEGITGWSYRNRAYYGFYDHKKDEMVLHKTLRDAYASLIDKISGKGTWESNPWVIAYSFELVK